MSESDRDRRDVIGLRLLLAFASLGVGILLLFLDVPPVVLTWETASEVGTAGFNVYRAPAWDTDSADSWTRVNPELIPAEGDEVVGASYRFEDEGLRPGRRYRYRIEEVEWDGTTTVYPDVVIVRAGMPRYVTKGEGVVLLLLGAFLMGRRLWSR
ncbi:MAG: hypothetical protein ACP5HG_04060 [Anaerolineae bacterium]